jgi:hypothetical protein
MLTFLYTKYLNRGFEIFIPSVIVSLIVACIVCTDVAIFAGLLYLIGVGR